MDTSKLVEMFVAIRDIPYRIPLRFTDPDTCCSGKAIQLRKFFESQSLEARFRVVDFKWSSLCLPKEVAEVKHVDDCTHVYVEVKLSGAWVKVDPTWDKGISSVLPLAEWDGEADTLLAVPVEKYYNDEDSERLMHPDETAFNKDIVTNGAFYEKFNQWLEVVRRVPPVN